MIGHRVTFVMPREMAQAPAARPARGDGFAAVHGDGGASREGRGTEPAVVRTGPFHLARRSSGHDDGSSDG